MPNWCEGTFRARGKLEDIKRFILKGIGAAGNDICRIKEVEPQQETGVSFEIETNYGMVWLIDTKRQFLELTDMDILDVYKTGPNGQYIFMAPLKAAWAIDEDGMSILADRYHISIKANGYEKGGGFEHVVEVNSAGVYVERKIKYYTDYEWDCPMPLLGG